MMVGLRNVLGTQGGVETHVRHLAEQLAMRGLSIEIITRSHYSRHTPDRLGTQIVLTPIWAPQSSRLEAFVHTLLSVLYAAVRRPKLLHIHAIGPGLMTPLARLFGLKVVVTHHGQDFMRERWGPVGRTALRTGERLSAAFANECIVVSSPLAVDLSKAYERPFWYIPNGVTPGTVTATRALVDTLGLSPGRYILNVGRLVPEKRQTDLVSAFLALNRDDLKLVMVGKADHDSDYSRELLKFGGQDDRIVFAGFQQGIALSELFSHAALFALPSSHEGLAIVALEAMSYGLPLLLSDIVANRALGLPAECYARTGSVESWTEGLGRQLGSAGVSGLDRIDWSAALLRYDWFDIAGQTVDVYTKVWREDPTKQSRSRNAGQAI